MEKQAHEASILQAIDHFVRNIGDGEGKRLSGQAGFIDCGYGQARVAAAWARIGAGLILLEGIGTLPQGQRMSVFASTVGPTVT